jgi:hypothetical protein
MVDSVMLTTMDNPYDPFTEFNEWFVFDSLHGYNTPSMLARITVLSTSLSEVDQEVAIELAIDEILKENVLGNYKKVFSNESNLQI